MQLLLAGLPAVWHAGVSFTYWVFTSQGQYVAVANVKFGTCVVCSPPPVLNFTFVGVEMWDYSPKTVKIWNFAHKFAHEGANRLPNFDEMFSICACLLAFIFLIWLRLLDRL